MALLILHDDRVKVTASSILQITRAAGVTVEAYIPKQFENALATTSIDSVLTVSGGSSGAQAAPVAAAVSAPAKEIKEDKKAGEKSLSLSFVDPDSSSFFHFPPKQWDFA
jgi:ribosomal protein L12E/L44/L45/RPP1/RPP2